MRSLRTKSNTIKHITDLPQHLKRDLTQTSITTTHPETSLRHQSVRGVINGRQNLEKATTMSKLIEDQLKSIIQPANEIGMMTLIRESQVLNLTMEVLIIPHMSQETTDWSLESSRGWNIGSNLVTNQE